ncbi:MAG TPA: lysophospholipase, partial [Candidatus Erysipelatoclostridium merdavium]|nr:lysophospholipase [Candidatus Erysipelatoclostridium merdavium]
AGLFRELLNGMIITNDSKAKIYLQCPVYLLSGKNDAVGEFGKGVNKAATLLLKQGANIKKIKLFENMRHDILHEKNCQEVYAYILDIIEKN